MPDLCELGLLTPVEPRLCIVAGTFESCWTRTMNGEYNVVQQLRQAATRSVTPDGLRDVETEVPKRMAVPTAFPLPRDLATAQALAVAAIHAAHAAGPAPMCPCAMCPSGCVISRALANYVTEDFCKMQRVLCLQCVCNALLTTSAPVSTVCFQATMRV